jgi:sulfoxide reductase catalytic subunit YedY
MHILKSRPWNLPESRVTPEALVFNRRQAMALGAGMLAAGPAMAQQAGLLPAMRNTRYVPGRAITAEREVTTYNNFYEFGSHKTISPTAQRMPMRPWTVKVEGMVEAPREYGIEDLLARMPLEERVYRLRCVEAWAMVVPWTGFPLSALLAEVKPLSSARYVVFQTATLLVSCPA